MARPLRIEYPGAIYHVMSRGNARQRIFRDDEDRTQSLGYLEDSVVRCGWELFSFVLMPNHFYLRRGTQRLARWPRRPRPCRCLPSLRSARNRCATGEPLFEGRPWLVARQPGLGRSHSISHEVSPSDSLAAWLSRRLSTATLRELATPLGLGRPESVSNLTRRMERQLAKDPTTRRELAKIEAQIARETKNKV